MNDKSEEFLTTKQLARETGLSTISIRHLAPSIPGAKNPTGSGWIFNLDSIQFLKNRKETRGRPKKNASKNKKDNKTSSTE